MTSQCFYQTVHNCANCIHKGVGQITTIIDRIFVKSLFIFTTAISSNNIHVWSRDSWDILCSFSIFQDDASAKLYLNIYGIDHQNTSASGLKLKIHTQFIPITFLDQCPCITLWLREMCHHGIRCLHHHFVLSHINLYCFTPCAPSEICYFCHFVSHISLPTNSFLHTFFVCNFAFSSLRSMIYWTLSGIITFVIKI